MVVGVTGHRSSHPSFPENSARLRAVIEDIFAKIDAALQAGGTGCTCTTALVTLLADGADHLAANAALERSWKLVTPLPFGRKLNAAINSGVATAADAKALLAGEPVADQTVADRAKNIELLADQACLFEMADEDEAICKLLLAALDHPDDRSALEKFQLAAARRAALAGTVLVEQSDLVIAIWDGQSVDSVGGTGHTVSAALETGCPVVWIDPGNPEQWQVFRSAEGLATGHARHKDSPAELTKCVRQAVDIDLAKSRESHAGLEAISPICWHGTSSFWSHAYRRIEAFFGTSRWRDKVGWIAMRYELPSEIGEGSQKAMLTGLATLPGADGDLPARVEREVLRRFAWTDAISSRLADRYRSSMVWNFILGAMAIIVGIFYLPLVDVAQKWIFALAEFILLVVIIGNTALATKRRVHGRWFETRRAAEYLRHSPFLLALGIARPPGHWPQGVRTSWPEWYARHALRAVGLPEVRVDSSYLRGVLEFLRDHHVDPQRDYHLDKAARLNRVRHKLDRISEISFILAVITVASYLLLAFFAGRGMVDPGWLDKAAKWFTVAAVALPTLGGAIAAIRYFADFERFADISDVTARRLGHVSQRIATLLNAPEERLDLGRVARVVHDTDDIVFSEIQAWQAVFSGKRTTIPA
ncbi:DUF4231 domain-containing protein [Erythrobacter litoralis]|uniref:SMODS and SLOG-associating 2TM effector domain-containing protein n=1 Tax=Erythrobacter litoralis (strain HTCC2594) TaxID=314225 RepID=Q2NDU4_ERYLH|nr:DUF4231 domain-containing protein [Erythrobacter litoralis]ABC62147.1 hypothetical protein ELI_00275 [Erythrobacter litoralis HTCC2594]